ncbi:AAA family ATPase [Pseudenhygromyxa sp. WMMC2535]|uniref:protein kinase domain-containing protein n=1 Tax=Pseudenhygromyxa sp. WMMC2535 TaxID=2712867 RepID=UPI001553C27F|nr:AAA family ATPase [Pseudenhygromyxa sp. WMMC2535]NVB42277.1 AAA family ATPase [Pseudenhygromyxa sp. WMMC2535]
MSVPLAGFKTLHLLRASARTRVYKAERVRDRRRVIAKVFEVEDESMEARVEHELRVLEALDVDGVVEALGVERAGRELVLLLDYVAGQDLAQLAGGQPLGVERFLSIASSLARILAEVHAKRIVHRDIKPSNVLIEHGSGRVVLADFGISVLLEQERRHADTPEVLLGTLPYISPEQTGRLRREVDFRSDLYSLGVTFYELLTGRLPFEASSALEVVHAHLARVPESPSRRVAEVPEQLSAMVMKLLAKAPEHRYQSARGLLADLERFSAAWARGDRGARFELAREDRSLVLQLPHQLYGRERERAILREELSAAIRESSRRVVLVSGAPGSGRSALLADVDKGFSGRVRLLMGKFEELGSDASYAAIVRAFSAHLEQILALDDEGLARWRERLSSALGSVAGVLTELVPALGLILGEREAVPTLPPAEALRRLHLAFGRLVTALMGDEPLILAFDDLQWADGASLGLLLALLEGRGPLLLLIGWRHEQGHVGRAYQELQDVEGPLGTELVRAIDRRRRSLRRIELGPLDRASLVQLLVDSLGRAPEELEVLVAYLERKTGKRPQLVRQLLLLLADEGLLRPEAEGWTWDMEALSELSIPEDALEMLMARLDRLGDENRAVLEFMACAGERFDPGVLLADFEGLETLALMGRGGRFAALSLLERDGFIDGIGQEFRFAHTRLHSHVYAEIAGDRRRRMHRAIGRWLHGQGDDVRLFELVDQLNASFPAGDGAGAFSDEDRRELAANNLRAGDRALAAGVWQAARRYYERAVEGGRLRGELGFQARFGLAQSQHLMGDFEAAARLFEALVGEAPGVVAQTAVLSRWIRVLAHTGEAARGIDIGIEALRGFGLEVPEVREVGELAAALGERVAELDLRVLFTLAPVRDERALAIMQLLHGLNTQSFSVDRGLFIHLTLAHLELLLREGYHSSALGVLHNVAFVLTGLQAFDAARRLCIIGQGLVEARGAEIGDQLLADRAWMLFVAPCFNPFAEIIELIAGAHQRAVEVGERLDATFKGGIGLIIAFEAGINLADTRALFERFHAAHPDWCSRSMMTVAGGSRWILEQLAGPFEGDQAWLPEMAPWGDEEVPPQIQYGAAINRMWAAMLLCEHERAWVEAERLAEDSEVVLFGSWAEPRFALFDMVLCAERIWVQGEDPGGQLRARIERRLETGRRWAGHGPANFGAIVDIMLGELAALDGEHGQATGHYEQARKRAGERGRIYLEAMASLRLAALAEREGWDVVREGALRSALDCFERWGAWLAAERVEDRLGSSLGRRGMSREQSATRTPLTGESSGRDLPSLDLAAILATVQTISEDLRLEEVLTRVLDSVVGSAGADRGLLLLELDGALRVVAEGSEGLTWALLDEPLTLADAQEQIPAAIVHYVSRTGASLVVDDALEEPRFASDPYIRRTGVRALLCMPIVKQRARVGVLVLENRLQAGAFSEARLETARILIAQAASILDNARLYAELARSEAQWRSLVDGAPDVITLLDEQGVIEFINHLGAFGVDPEGLIGLRPEDILDPASIPRWREAISEVLGTGDVCEVELSLALGDNPARWFTTHLAPIRVEGRPIRVLSIARDITERKRFDLQVRQQQRLESIGTLAAGVAHEINNPVQGILNYAELISERSDDAETVLEFSREITAESQRVATIVRNLLVFARQERELSFEEADVAVLLESTLSLVRSVIRKDAIELSVEIEAGVAQVRCRPQQIRQVIMNLVTNARDALNDRYPDYDADKRLAIRVRMVSRSSEEAPEELEGWVQIVVEDHGGGIPEQVRAHIFDPFFTTKGRDQGTGLGLSVSHGIVVEHGGVLRVETAVGEGTRFFIELPGVG